MMSTLLAAAEPTPPPTKICPLAPPGAQQYADQLMGYVLWAVGLLFILGVIVGIGAIVAGRVFSIRTPAGPAWSGSCWSSRRSSATWCCPGSCAP